MRVVYRKQPVGPGFHATAVEAELFEACDALGYPEAAAMWDASEIAGAALPDLMGKVIRLYNGRWERFINKERITDICLRICVGEHAHVVGDGHHRFDWSKRLGWLDIKKISDAERAAGRTEFGAMAFGTAVAEQRKP